MPSRLLNNDPARLVLDINSRPGSRDAVLTRAGFRVIHADSAGAALDSVRAQAPAIAIIDGNLPGATELCRTIKSEASSRCVVLLICSDADRSATSDASCPDAVLSEQATPADLVSVVTLLSRIARAERNRAQLAAAVALSPPGIPTTALPDDSEFGTALRASQALYGALTRAMPQIVYLSGPAGESLYLNQHWFDYTGMSAEQSRGYGYLSAVHPDDAGPMEDLYQDCAAEQLPFAAEYRLRGSDGSYRWHSTRAVPLLDDQRKIIGWVGVAIDIDDRKRQEKALERSEEQVRLAAEAAGAGLWFWDLEKDELVWNDRCKACFGLSPETAITYSVFLAALHPEDRERTDRAVREAIEAGADYHIEYRTVWPDGSVHWLAATGRCFGAHRSRRERFMGAVLDITERKRSKAALRENDRRKDEFLAMLGHELRNPIVPVRNAVELLKRGARGAAADSALELLERQVGHLARLVDELLDVSRISTGKIALQTGPLDLRNVLRDAIETARPLIEQRRHRLETAFGPAEINVSGDEMRLSQVFANLLNNAAKYTPEFGTISVEATRDGGEAVVIVRDSGVGMPAEFLPHVFELFAQDPATASGARGGGLGIGLTIARRLVELHGGKVSAHSPGIGKGSEFVVRIPLLSEAKSEVRLSAANPPDETRSRRVLVVDDNRDAADSIVMLLEMEGHQVKAAYDGQTALSTAAEFRPEVVLLDLALPDIDGYSLAAKLREQDRRGAATMIALSGYGRASDHDRASGAGFKHHLVKPPEINQLLSIVARS